MDPAAFPAQVLRDPADVLHDGRGIAENIAVNALQDETGFFGPRGGIDDEGVVDVAAAEAFGRIEPGSVIEL